MMFKRRLFKEFLKFLGQINGHTLKDTEFVTVLPCGSKVVIRIETSPRAKLRIVKIN